MYAIFYTVKINPLLNEYAFSPLLYCGTSTVPKVFFLEEYHIILVIRFGLATTYNL